MDIKFISSLMRPWLIAPNLVGQYEQLAKTVLAGGSVPVIDKRERNTYRDYYEVFRVDADGTVNNKDGVVQVFRLDAPISKYNYCGSPGSQTWIQHLEAANADPTVQSIVLWIDSPGGQVDGTERFSNAVRDSKKPVVAYCDSMMASAAYWIGSGAKQIIVDDSNGGWNAVIGSIGTMAMFIDDSEAMEKEGRRMVTVFADDSSDKWGEYFKMKEGDFTRLKAELNGINATFLEGVKANRAGKLKLKKENTLSGKTYNANEAIEFGLADRKGNLMDAITASLKYAKQFSNKTKNRNMSKLIVAFATAMAVAEVESFEVVEGGFLLTEESLAAIDKKLKESAALISATAEQLASLQAKKKEFETAAEDKAALEQANVELVDANERILALEAEKEGLTASLATANEQVKKFGGNPPAGGFSETNADGDPEVVGEGDEQPRKLKGHEKRMKEAFG